MSKEIQEIYKIQEVLKKNNYFDISRISKEIQALSKEKNIPLEDIFKRIELEEPWEYISGKTEFCSNKFLVNRDTLIPRIETEDLVEICYKKFSSNKSYLNIVDIGTGSGCIVISLCKRIGDNNINFVATDISEDALDTAKKNAKLNGVEKLINFVNTNLIDSIEIKSNTLLIANLPYIPAEMYESLDRSVKEYEPKTALEGGIDGLEFYKELLKQLEEKIQSKKNITLIVEIEPSTLEDFKILFSGYNVEIAKDFREKERFVLIHLC